MPSPVLLAQLNLYPVELLGGLGRKTEHRICGLGIVNDSSSRCSGVHADHVDIGCECQRETAERAVKGRGKIGVKTVKVPATQGAGHYFDPLIAQNGSYFLAVKLTLADENLPQPIVDRKLLGGTLSTKSFIQSVLRNPETLEPHRQSSRRFPSE